MAYRKAIIIILFFMDGNLHKQETFFVDQLAKLWKEITLNKGTYHSCNHNKGSYKRLAIGTLVHDDLEKSTHCIWSWIT